MKEKYRLLRWKKEIKRFVAMFLVVAIVMCNIPMQTTNVKANVLKDWEIAEVEIGTPIAAAYGNGIFLAMNSEGQVFSSENGMEWVLQGQIDTDNVFGMYQSLYELKMSYCGEQFYLYGARGILLQSSDGVAWETIDFGDDTVKDVIYTGLDYYALTGRMVEDSGIVYIHEKAQLYTSKNGQDWDVLKSREELELQVCGDACYAEDKLVVVDETDYKIYTYDLEGELLNIHGESDISWGNYANVSYANGVFAVAAGNGVFSSADGIDWEYSEYKKYISSISNQSLQYWNGSLWMLSDRNGSCYQFEVPSLAETESNNYKFTEGSGIRVLAASEEILMALGENMILYRRCGTQEEDNGNDYNIKLSEDTVVDGDYELLGKSLDLNGYTLTVSGNLLHKGGDIATNGGKVVVTGDYIVDEKSIVSGDMEIGGSLLIHDDYLECDKANITVSGNFVAENGKYNHGISMTHDEDYIFVQGNMIYNVPYSVSKTAGTIAVKGDVQLLDGYITDQTHKLRLEGNETQAVTVSETHKIANLELANTSEGGVVCNGFIDCKECVNNGGSFSYSSDRKQGIWGYTLQQDTVVEGDLYVADGVMDLNGYQLTVTGNYLQHRGELYINGGTLEVGGNFDLNYKADIPSNVCLRMQNERDYVKVGGNFNFDSDISTEGFLTDGTLEIGGNFIQSSDTYFVATGNHRVYLASQNADQKFTVKFLSYGGKTKFHTLQLCKNYKNYYNLPSNFKKMCDEFLYTDDTEIPSTISDLTVSSITGTALGIKWSAATDNSEVAGYRIYRNGELIKDEYTFLSYLDKEVQLGEEYTYNVTAIDPFHQESEMSNSVTVSPCLPEITSVYPVEGTILGTSASVSVYQKNYIDAPNNKLQISYYDEENQAYVDVITTKVSSGTTYRYTWDLTGFTKDGDMKVKYVLRDIYGSEIEQVVIYHLDRTAPEIPTDIAVADAEKRAVITWTKSTSADCSRYIIYRKEAGAEKYLQIAAVNSSYATYTDSKVEDGKTYEYIIKAEDTNGNVSSATDPVEIYIQPDETAPVISYMLYDSAERVKLPEYETGTYRIDATDNRKVVRYELYVKKDGAIVYTGDYTKEDYYPSYKWDGTHAFIEINYSQFTDGEYEFIAYAFDEAGNRGEASCVVEFDGTGPAQPVIVKQEIDCTSAYLEWEKSKESDFFRYYVKKLNGTQWSTVKSSTDNYLEITGLQPGTTYQYKIYGVDDLQNDGEATEITLTTPKDTEAPTTVTGTLVTYRTGSKVKLKWTASTDNVRVTSYNVYRNGEKIAENITGCIYTDENLENETKYTYCITASDAAGNESEAENGVEITTSLPVIKGITPQQDSAIGGEITPYEVLIANDSLAGVRKIKVDYYDEASDAWKEIVPESDLSSVSVVGNTLYMFKWDHSAILEDQMVKVRITVTDADDNSTEKILSYHLDRTAPQLPGKFEVTSKDDQAILTWSMSASEDCEGYRLYGRMQGEETYSCIANISATSAESYSYVHKNLTQMATYEYYLVLYDSVNNENTTETKTVFIDLDTIPPSPPTDVSVRTRSGSSITLAWNGATDNVGVTSYNVYRNGALVGENISGYTYKDTGLEENTLYTYQITALDEAGNESEKTDGLDSAVAMPEILNMVPDDYETIGGEQIKVCVYFKDSGNSVGNTVQLFWYDEETQVWNKITEEPLEQKNYQRGKLQAYSTWTLPVLETEYDVDVDVKAVLTDIDGNTDEKTVTYTIDKTAPNPPGELKAEENNGVIIVSYTPSSSVDTEGYCVYRKKLEGDTFTKIDEVSGRATNWYQDKTVDTGVTYVYRVTSYDTYGQEGTYSESDAVYVTEDEDPPKIKSMTPDPGTVNKTIRVNVEGSDNRAVTKVKFYIRSDEEIEWTLLGEEAAENNVAEYVWDTTGYEEAVYYIKAVAIDAAGNENENLYQRRYEVDNTGIRKIQLADCVAGSTMIQLEWEDVTEEDFSYFCVEQQIGDAWISRAKVTDKLGYVAKELKPETTYTFRVVGYDALGNRGEESDAVTLTTNADNIGPSITRIDPVSSYYGEEIALSMQVKDNAEIEKGIFSYTIDGETYTIIKEITAKGENSQQTFSYTWNTAELPEGEIIIRFEAYDSAGNHNQLLSDGNQVENKYTIDHTAPGKITRLVATGAEGYVELTWEQSKEDDLKAYRIYRADSADGQYALLAEKKTKNHYDTSVVRGRSYYYKISVVDIAKNEGEMSEYAAGSALPDTTAPIIVGIAPSEGEKLGKNTSFSVLATDNAELAEIRMEYREKESDDVWQEFSAEEVVGRQKYVRIPFTAEELAEDTLYEMRAVAYDQAGNASEYVTSSYTFDLTAPSVPEVETESMSYRIGIRVSENTDSDFDKYEIYRKALGESDYKCIQSMTETYYEDTTTKVDTIYYYKVRAYDIYGNYSESAVVHNYANSIDTIAPVAELSETYMMVTDFSAQFDGTQSTDNVRIVKYEWNFGDGTKKTGAKPTHTYKEASTYTISLTVTDAAGNQDSTIATVTVLDSSNNGQGVLKIIDENGAPVSGAHVYIKTGNSDDEVIRTRADGDGEVNVVTKAGVYEFAAYAEGYLPKEDTIRISNYEKLSKELVLQKGEVVSGKLTATRMSLEELVEYGVDLSDPENYNTFTFRVELKFEDSPIPVVYEYADIPMPVSSTRNEESNGGNYYVSEGKKEGRQIQAICKENEEGELEVEKIVVLSTTQSVSWLKDMYNVKLTVINNADSSFPIEEASATLSLPEGLSLAKTKSGQTLTTQMGTIGGQTSADANWIVRGDESGTYSISAAFHGILMPFDVPIDNVFATEQDFEVKAGEGLRITIQPEDSMYLSSKYYIQFKIQNVSDREFYNLRTTLGEYIKPAQTVQHVIKDRTTGAMLGFQSRTQGQTYHSSSAAKCKTIPVLYEGDTVEIGVFSPGEEICCTYVTDVAGSVSADYYYRLVDSLVQVLEGANLGVEVQVDAIASHLSRYIYYTAGTYPGSGEVEEEEETYGDPVDVASGAFTQQINALSVTGASTLEYALNYNSLLADSVGENGYGWSHSYEQSIKDIGGVIELHSTPYSVASFVNEELNSGVVYGYQSGGTVVLDDEADYLGTYVATGTAMKGATIEKKKENDTYRYVLTDMAGTVTTFDADGKLLKIEDKSGKSVSFGRKDDKLTVTDDISGEKLVIAYKDGKVSAVSDAHDRKCSFTYDEEGNLTAYQDPLGNQTRFVYDDTHHMTKCTNPDGVVVVENTYDEKGRTMSQVEVGSDKKSVFTYEEKENGGFVTKIKKRDGNKIAYETDRKGNIIKETDEIGEVTEYIFDQEGNVLDEIAPDGSRTMYEYDEAGNMTAAYDTAGNVTTYTYDPNCNPVAVTSADGLTSKYEYDEKNRMVGYTSPLGVKTTYEYDEDGNLTREFTPGLGAKTYTYQQGRKVSGTDCNGNKTTFTYDAYGNITSTTDALGNTVTCVYDATGKVLSETDANGVTTAYTYDKNGNKKTETIGERTIHYSYDEAGRLTKLTNAMGDETLYTYDTEGNLTSITYPDKTKSSYVYDAKGRVTKETDPDGSVHTYVYDKMGFLTQETHAGIVTDYTYYPNGKLHKEIYADGTSNTYTYDVNWNVISVMDQDDNTTTYTYDAMSHVTSVTDALGNQVTYTYDTNGRRIKETDARGYETTYAYDGNGNCVKTTTPDGTVVEYTYDGANNPTKVSTQTTQGEITVSYKYDKKGQLIETTDALGNVTKITYDTYGNVWKVTDAYGNIVEENTYDAIDQLIKAEDGVGSIATYSYDKSANITKAVMAAGTENESSYVYSYDKMGRILTSTDPLSGRSSYTYNAAGQIATVKDPMGGVTSYEYDALQRVKAVVSPIQTRTEYTYNAQGLLAQETNARAQNTEYTYDALGRITEIKDEIGTIRYTYDANGNILTVSEQQGLLETKEITRTYDCMNRVTSYTDYNGKTIEYGYDELGNRISLTYPGGEIVRYSYDKNGKLLSVTDPDGAETRYEYDKNGRISKVERPDGSCETYTHNNAGYMTSQKDVAADGSVIHHYTYTYDEHGNVTEMTGKGEADYSVLKNAVMTYDADNRLVTYNGEKVVYDADGNMLCGPLDGRMADFTYDCRNRLVKVETEDGAVTEYEYDAENTRISETCSETKRVYVTDVESTYSQLLTETVYSKNLLGFYTEKEEEKLYVYGAGLISEQTELEKLYYHYNNIGSTTEITSDEGNIIYRFVYGTYGELVGIEDETGENLLTGSTVLSQILSGLDIRFLYNGQLGVQTDESGLYYMRARYYNTDIKRFINRDVVNGSIENSQSLNKYSYVQGNPVKLTDPFGLEPVGGDPYSIFSAVGHTILDVAGIFWDGADIINALWYAAEGNMFMAATCALSALPVIGSMVAGGLKVGLKGSKAALKAGKYIKQTTRLISHSSQMTMSAIDSYYAAIDYKQARANGESGAVEGLQFAMSMAGTAMSAGGVVSSAKGLKGLFKKDKNPIGNALCDVKRGVDPEIIQDVAKHNCGKQVMVGGKLQWQCFVAGTLIKTENGNVPIEEIEPGDAVYAKDTETGEEGYKEVVRLFVSQKDTLVHVTIGDEQIDTTTEHPFWVDGKGFVEAHKLSVGDNVLTADGELKTITKVTTEQLENPVTVYNFEVKDWHTYYVSEEEILVHNQCGVAGESGTNASTYYHSCSDEVADVIASSGFRTDIPDKISAFHNNRYGRGVYLADTPTTALAERPGGTILKVTANSGKNLNLTSRGVIGGNDYSMTHAIARGARKHGYDSITFMSAKNQNGINTVIFNPVNINIVEVMR